MGFSFSFFIFFFLLENNAVYRTRVDRVFSIEHAKEDSFKPLKFEMFRWAAQISIGKR